DALMMQWFAALALVACSSPPPHHQGPNHATDKPVVTNNDSAHAQPIKLTHYSGNDEIADFEDKISRAGTWWYTVEFVHHAATVATAEVAVEYDGPDGALGVQVLDDRAQPIDAAVAVRSGRKTSVVIPESATTPEELVVLLTTTEPVGFRLHAVRRWRDP